MSELKYRISKVTSEHPRYPAANLLVNQQGWQSAINCDYPQAITIQFFVPIQTKKVHLLFHQYKIPHLIEVFVKLGAPSPYRRLGYLVPNDNSQSSFEQKQQKTLYFQFSVTHIMLVLHNNYKNERNIFNQVALEDLNVFGQILSNKDISGVDLTEDLSSDDDDVSQSIEVSHNARTVQTKKHQTKEQYKPNPQSSKLFQPIYQKLQNQKQLAIERQDFQKAAHYKKIIINFSQIEEEINRLEKQKQNALSRQDYDACHRIKLDLAKKKEVVQFQKQQLFKNQDQFYSQNSFLSIDRNPIIKQQSKVSVSPARMAQFKSPEPERKYMNNSSMNKYDEQIVPALLNKGGKSTQHLPLETNEKKRDISLEINQSIIAQAPAQADNTSIKKDLNDLKGLNDNSNQVSISTQQKTFELEPLENKLRLRIQTYFSFIPQKIWQVCQNKNWKAKQEALKFVKQKLGQIQTKQQFMGTIELISRIIVSKQATISIDVIHLLNRLADIKVKFSIQHMPFFVQDILNELLNFLNDTNRQIKELAYTTYLKLPQISFLGLNIVTRQLIKHKNKVKNDPKLIITKIQLMSALLQRYSHQQFSHKDIINWILSYFQDPNQKVRAQATELLVTLTYLIGNEKVIKIIQSNKPHMMESVLNMMNSSVEYSKIHNQQSKLSLENSKLQQQFYGHQSVKPNKNNSNVLGGNNLQVNKSERPIFLLQSNEKAYQMEQSKSSRNQNANIDLSYSKQSIYEQSAQPSNIQVGNSQQIRVYEDYPYQQQGKCSYCSQYFQDQRVHYISSCKVLIFCEKCDGYIYIREFTHHLLQQCQYSHMFTLCKKCGIALDLEDSNEHIGRDICKNKKGVNWERCQFCSEDIFAEDKFWIKHAHQCHNLPPKNPQSNSLDANDEDS